MVAKIKGVEFFELDEAGLTKEIEIEANLFRGCDAARGKARSYSPRDRLAMKRPSMQQANLSATAMAINGLRAAGVGRTIHAYARSPIT